VAGVAVRQRVDAGRRRWLTWHCARRQHAFLAGSHLVWIGRVARGVNQCACRCAQRRLRPPSVVGRAQSFESRPGHRSTSGALLWHRCEKETTGRAAGRASLKVYRRQLPGRPPESPSNADRAPRSLSLGFQTCWKREVGRPGPPPRGGWPAPRPAAALPGCPARAVARGVASACPGGTGGGQAGPRPSWLGEQPGAQERAQRVARGTKGLARSLRGVLMAAAAGWGGHRGAPTACSPMHTARRPARLTVAAPVPFPPVSCSTQQPWWRQESQLASTRATWSPSVTWPPSPAGGRG